MVGGWVWPAGTNPPATALRAPKHSLAQKNVWTAVGQKWKASAGQKDAYSIFSTLFQLTIPDGRWPAGWWNNPAHKLHFIISQQLLFQFNYWLARRVEIIGSEIDFLVCHYFITINPRSQTVSKTPRNPHKSGSFWVNSRSIFGLISGSFWLVFVGPLRSPKCTETQGNVSVLSFSPLPKGFVLGALSGSLFGTFWEHFRPHVCYRFASDPEHAFRRFIISQQLLFQFNSGPPGGLEIMSAGIHWDLTFRLLFHILFHDNNSRPGRSGWKRNEVRKTLYTDSIRTRSACT